MGPRKPELFLVKPGAAEVRRDQMYRTDEIIPHSGIYRVLHRQHRLPHEVTLLRDQQFPRCAKCATAVSFELVQAAQVEQEDVSDGRMRIVLYELPELESEGDEGQIAV
ncbi:MAG TPA: hypothetical protein VFK81_10420 [Terriglobales bacterium]|nr:hypothetical protein [Terriglobales bacterium]